MATQANPNTPFFAFRIYGMKPRGGRQREGYGGMWIPGNSRNANLRDERGDVNGGQLYAWNPAAGHVQPVGNAMESELVLCDTLSVYYDHGRFWCINCNAIDHAFGNALNGAENSDAESDADASGDEDTDATPYDWFQVGFNHDSEDWSTHITYPGNANRLACQRQDQDWINKLLPNIYHAAPGYQNVQRPYGGVSGNLALMIALVAFSVSRSRVHETLMYCIRGDRWLGHNHTTGNGWRDRRGLIVYLYRHPMAPAAIEDYEDHKIYP